MSAPDKPNYPRLRAIIENEVMWGIQGRQAMFERLVDRAEWLEAERDRLAKLSRKTRIRT